MLGIYEDFPDTFHCAASYTHKTSKTNLQKTVINVFYALNKQTHNLSDIVTAPSTGCSASFECGVAEALTFNFIDDEEIAKFKRLFTEKTVFSTMDFMCIIRYHVKGKPLKFDHFMLRFSFQEKTMLILVYHEKGPQRVQPEELLSFLAKNIANELRGKAGKKP